MSFFGDSIRWVASIGFHPLSALPGSGPGRSLGPTSSSSDWFYKNCNDLFFLFKIWLKKLFFSLNFPIKKHAFPAFPSFFGHFFGRLHHLPLWTSPWDFHPVVGSVLFRTSSIPRTSSLNVSPGKSPSLRNGRVQVPEPSSVNFYSC